MWLSYFKSWGGTYAFFGGSSLQQLWNESTIHDGRGRIQRLRLWTLQAPCLSLVIPQPPVEPDQFESYPNLQLSPAPILRKSLWQFARTSDNWHSIHVNDMGSTSVNWPQLSIRVSWLFQWIKSKGRWRYLSTESHGHCNRCSRVWLHLLEIKIPVAER